MPSSDKTRSDLTHINEAGHVHMVDVSDKPPTVRVARAQALVRMLPATLRAIQADEIGKGDVLATARIAAIGAAKRCSDLIPLCHPLPLSRVRVDIDSPDDCTLAITVECKVTGPTGVEMEALTAASVAGLTIYDMCKAIDRGMSIERVALLHKSGGASGDFDRVATVGQDS